MKSELVTKICQKRQHLLFTSSLTDSNYSALTCFSTDTQRLPGRFYLVWNTLGPYTLDSARIASLDLSMSPDIFG